MMDLVCQPTDLVGLEDLERKTGEHSAHPLPLEQFLDLQRIPGQDPRLGKPGLQ
jgi:hypothetical protein